MAVHVFLRPRVSASPFLALWRSSPEAVTLTLVPLLLGFSSPIWRNTILALLGGFAAYRFSNLSSQAHPSPASSSGLSAPGNESDDAGETPLITRYLEHYGPSVDALKERNARHLDLVRQRAEDRLFFDSAERPAVHRLRYTGLLDQASQHRQPVGGTVDMSGVRAKGDSD
ncbi:hypothetical protein FA09DRAFT_330550 [Tilletiopsis washingtonensis]|uniref:Uncharacterized protein n=1 Tax=Tilletiopsis washingtonensis TaxID=58919 RepID=A0A316Z8M1_9BASI|nr:hypothetical protein FA09DRAFT_330550 [Tilletiopsis washingtonensis]PWN97384.1 hypothetical protein FA09DRAFT_330550 [Tilletiopsis washingtonensis]